MAYTNELLFTYISESKQLCIKKITDLNGTNETIRKVNFEDIDLNNDLFDDVEIKRSNPDIFNTRDKYHTDRNLRKLYGDQNSRILKDTNYKIDYIGTNTAIYLGNPISNIIVYQIKVRDKITLLNQIINNKYEVVLNDYSFRDQKSFGGNANISIITSDQDEDILYIDQTRLNQSGPINITKLLYERFGLINTDTALTWGDLTTSDSIRNKHVKFSVDNSNISNVVVDNSLHLDFLPDMSNKTRAEAWIEGQDENILSLPLRTWSPTLSNYQYSMSQSSELLSSGYDVYLNWNPSYYSVSTGETLRDHDYILSGVPTVTLFLPSNDTFQKIAYNEYSGIAYSISRDAETQPVFKDTNDASVSGYNNVSNVILDINDNSSYKYSVIEYLDINNVIQNTNVVPSQRLDFSTNLTHKKYNGKNIRIGSYYENIDDVETIYSEYLSPTYDEYYDIKDVVLTMSGVKYNHDTELSESYEKVVLQTNNETITKNLLSQDFKTTTDVYAILDFTLLSNDIDLSNFNRLYHPSPENMWLIGVPYSALSSDIIKNIVFKIPNRRILTDREINRRWLDYPKVDTIASSGIIDLCTGTANTATTYDEIIWNNTGTLSINENPEIGSFSENDYTISVKLDNGRWAIFLIIKDSTNNYTGYCVSNKKDFELPTVNDFEV